MACSKLGIELVQVVSFRKESQIWIFCQYFHLTLPGKQINAEFMYFTSFRYQCSYFVWVSLGVNMATHHCYNSALLLPLSPMLLFKLWSQCHGAWHNSSLSVWKFPEGAFFAFCGSAWATFLSGFSLSSGLLLCPFLLCGCAHKKEEPFNLLWVLKNEISTQNESIASTCRAVRTSVSCPNTITQTAIRIIFVCSSVLGFQWSRISQPYLCV